MNILIPFPLFPHFTTLKNSLFHGVAALFVIIVSSCLLTQNALAQKIGVKIKSNAFSGNVMQDGIATGSLTGGETEVELKKGWNTVVINSKGYVPTASQIYIGPSGPFTVFIELEEAPANFKTSNPFKFPTDEKLMPSRFSSSCKYISEFLTEDFRQHFRCDFVSLEQELASSGPLISFENKTKNPAFNLLTAKFISLTLEPYNENWKIVSESALNLSKQTIAYEMVAFSSLIGGDCNRTSEIYSQLIDLKRFSAPVWLSQAICHELHDQPLKANGTLKRALKSKQTDSFSSAALHYHKARLEFSESTERALTSLGTCMSKFPWYQNCFQLAYNLELTRKQLKSAQNMLSTFRLTAQKTIGPKVHQAIKTSAKGKFREATKILSELGRFEASFSASWLKVIIEKSRKKKVSTATLNAAKLSKVFATKPAGRVANLVEKLGDYELTQNAYKVLIRDVPENPFFLWKYSGFLLKNGKCSEVTALEIPPLINKPREKAGLLEHRARCHTILRNYDPAIEEYKKMIKLSPRNWKGHYQLAEAYIKTNANLKALSSYRQAQALNPPKNFKKIIAEKLKVLGDKPEIKE